VVAVIAFIVGGIVFLTVAAMVVGVMDIRPSSSSHWRRVAEERRREWEERVLELQHGGPEPGTANDDWDDD
jgi:hypothetical protein